VSNFKGSERCPKPSAQEKKAKYKNNVDTNGLKETLSQKLVFHSTGPTSGQQPAQKISCIIHDLGHF
jgi:hypothetical protein